MITKKVSHIKDRNINLIQNVTKKKYEFGKEILLADDRWLSSSINPTK